MNWEKIKGEIWEDFGEKRKGRSEVTDFIYFQETSAMAVLQLTRLLAFNLHSILLPKPY